MKPAPVAVDLQGAQSVDHRDRGVARYVLEHARALERTAPGRVEHFLLNPDLPPPGGIEDLIATGRVTTGEPALDPDVLLHVMSPFELSIPFDRLLPRRRRNQRLIVTLYDLIPDILADRYLADPGLRRRWRTRAGLVRRADGVVAISECTARDGIERLGLSESRVRVVGTGTSKDFQPPADRDAVREQARRALPGLASRWVLFTGGTDERKNVERLLEAWALLPAATRAEWQLVVACKVDDLQRNHLLVRATQLGFPEGLLVPGFVPDADLVMLNQGADLAVFPSLYEGYGLPIAEALACGTPAVASDRSSLPELVPPEGLFDPLDPVDMASTIDAALRDPTRRAAISGNVGRPPTTWDDVAIRTLENYDRIATLDRPRARFTGPLRTRERAGRRIALVTPLPDLPTGVASFSRTLAGELRRLDDIDVDVYVDAPPHHRRPITEYAAPGGVTVRPLGALATVENLDAPYDAVVCSLGNSEFHTGALDVLRRRAGIVLAHDVVLTNLWHFAQFQHPGAVPGGLHGLLQQAYDGLPPDLGSEGVLTRSDVERWGVPMTRPAVAWSDRYLVTSEFAAAWARLDARPEDEHKIESIPFPLPSPDPAAEDDRAPNPLISTFGLVDEAKLPDLLVDAFALLHRQRPDARLAFVGPVDPTLQRVLEERAGSSRSAVEFTGHVDRTAYRSWLHRSWVGAQLRAHTNGEASAAAADCLSAGLPLVASAVGSTRDLPADAAVLVDRDVAPADLADLLLGLLADAERRRRLARAGVRHASERSFRSTAVALAERVLS